MHQLAMQKIKPVALAIIKLHLSEDILAYVVLVIPHQYCPREN